MIRQATINDIPAIMAIVDDAKEKFQLDGSLQWVTGGYPYEETFIDDIASSNKLLLVLDEDGVVATCTLSFEEENCYKKINGSWIDENYATIHRIAVKKEYYHMHCAKRLFLECEKIALNNNVTSIRVDTHEANIAMRKLVESIGYNYCGTITLEKRPDILELKRLAFQKVLTRRSR